MLQSYRLPKEISKEAKTLGEKITELVVSSAVTYKDAEDALEFAQELLMATTRPVKRQVQ